MAFNNLYFLEGIGEKFRDYNWVVFSGRYPHRESGFDLREKLRCATPLSAAPEGSLGEILNFTISETCAKKFISRQTFPLTERDYLLSKIFQVFWEMLRCEDQESRSQLRAELEMRLDGTPDEHLSAPCDWSLLAEDADTYTAEEVIHRFCHYVPGPSFCRAEGLGRPVAAHDQPDPAAGPTSAALPETKRTRRTSDTSLSVTKKTLPRLLRRARKEAGHTQQDAADACEVQLATLKSWEEGLRFPRVEALKTIRDYIQDYLGTAK